MKKFILLLVLILTLPMSLSAQFGSLFLITYSSYCDVTFTDTDTDTLYVLYPSDENRWYISETLPTIYYSSDNRRDNRFAFSGDLEIYLELNASTGMAAAETDSFYSYIKPLFFEPKDQEYSIAKNDSFFITYNVATTYTTVASGSYTNLDWTDGLPYCSKISDGMWPVAGFVVISKQSNYTVGIAVGTFWFSISRDWR